MVDIRLPMKKKTMVKRSYWMKSRKKEPLDIKINLTGLKLFEGGE